MLQAICQLFLVSFLTTGLVEEAVTSDTAFMDKIKAAKINVLEAGEAEKNRKTLWETLDIYWDVFEKEDLEAVYAMYSDEYRAKVSLSSFLKRKKFALTKYEISEVVFWGDQCSQVRYRISVDNGGMVLNNLSMKHFWVFRDGKWQKYENPNRPNAMFHMPKDGDAPCVLPPKQPVAKKN